MTQHHSLDDLFGGVDDDADDLDDLFDDDEATRKANDVTRLLEAVEGLGGTALVDFLTKNGHSTGALRAACTKPEGDKRRQPLLRANTINGQRLVTLTSNGWSAVGKPNKREQRPSPERIAHSMAPTRIADRITAMVGAYGPAVTINVATSVGDMSEWQSNVTGKAWGRINSGSQLDGGGQVGELTRGVPRPDALIYEEWVRGLPEQWPDPWPDFGTFEAGRRGAYVQLTHLLEVETASKRTNALLAKVQRLNTVMDLGAADTVLWVVDDPATAHRIRAVVLSENKDDKRHRYADLSQFTTGVDGGAVPQGFPKWWPSQVAR